MIFTQEQFDKILDGDKGIYLDDLPFETQGLEFFNALPDHLQGEALQWGFSDTVVRENIFVFLIENQFGMTVKEYYASGILDKYYDSKVPIPVDYKRLKMTRKELKETKPVYADYYEWDNEKISMETAAKTIGLDLVYVKPGGNRIESVSPTFVYSNPGIILFEKDYYGFEDMFDLDRDMSEILSFENKDKVPSEFSGIVRVSVEYYPSDDDLELIKNM